MARWQRKPSHISHTETVFEPQTHSIGVSLDCAVLARRLLRVSMARSARSACKLGVENAECFQKQPKIKAEI